MIVLYFLEGIYKQVSPNIKTQVPIGGATYTRVLKYAPAHLLIFELEVPSVCILLQENLLVG